MKRNSIEVVFLVGFFATTWQAHAQDAGPPPTPDTIAGECQVSIVETPHMSIEKFFRNNEVPASCDIEFKDQWRISAGRSGIGLLIYPRNLESDDNYIGFSRLHEKADQWRFDGTADLLLASRIVKHTFSQQQDGEGTLLVGHQLLRGKMPNGGITELPGIRILRLTPQFVMSVEMNFEPMTSELSGKAYQQRYDAISRELVEIVKSLRPTPGKPGPTVRQP